jgi:hypothetical protein
VFVQRNADGGGEQFPRVAVPQTVDHELAQSSELLDRLACCEHNRNRLRQQSAGHERERLGGGPVQPLRIVDQAHKRPRLGRLRQQAQYREADQEAIGCRPPTQAERGAKRVALWGR